MLKIDSEFKNLIPPLSSEEFAQLEQNCLSDGIRESIITWQGIIIDGHNRYEIAQKHELEYEVLDKEFLSRAEVIEWIILNQFGRRNLSMYDRAKLALTLKEIFEAKAKANKGTRTDLLLKSAESLTPIDTRAELAKIAGVGHDTMYKVGKIEESANPVLQTALTDKTLTINKAYELTKQIDSEVKEQTAERLDALNAENEARKQAETERAKQSEIQARVQAETDAFMQEQSERNRILEAKLKAERERAEAERAERERLHALEIEKLKANERAEAERLAKERLKEIELEKKAKKEERIEARSVVLDEIKERGENAILPSLITLYEGDLFDKIDLIPDGSIDLLCTDPPYMILSNDWDTFKNKEEFLDFTENWLNKVMPKIKATGRAYISFAHDYKYDLYKILDKNNFYNMNFGSEIIWYYKNNNKPFDRKRYRFAYEPVIYLYGNEAPTLNFTPDTFGEMQQNVWEIATPQSNFNEGKYHSAQKPLELYNRIIKTGSFENDTILDCFAGSGTTGIVCSKLNRKAILIERDLENIKIIKGRL